MNNGFENISSPSKDLFFHSDDPEDRRLGDIVSATSYEDADIVIVGCPQEEGVIRRGGPAGSAASPDLIRREFYRFTNFGITRKIFDLGNIVSQPSLEQTHEALTSVVAKLLRDEKRVISLGGGNDIAYADGKAMSDVFGGANWLAINVDAKFDTKRRSIRDNETSFRQLLDESRLLTHYLYQVGFQGHVNSPAHFEELRSLGAKMVGLEQLRSQDAADDQLKHLVKQEFIHHSSALSTFFSFDMGVVRAADAPGTNYRSPLGLRVGELLQLVKYAGSLANTKLIEFSEVNSKFDIDDRTVKLVAIAMHRFCTAGV